MSSLYDNDSFFRAYAQMDRSRGGLSASGEWHQLKPLFPDLQGRRVLDLGCGYGWHCRYAAEQGAAAVLGIDLSEKNDPGSPPKEPVPGHTYRVCGMDAYEYPAEAFDLVISQSGSPLRGRSGSRIQTGPQDAGSLPAFSCSTLNIRFHSRHPGGLDL